MNTYGADYSTLKNHFPSKTTKQIRKKYSQFEKNHKKHLEKRLQQKVQERKKNFFDDVILESNMIKWLSKPKCSEDSSKS